MRRALLAIGIVGLIAIDSPVTLASEVGTSSARGVDVYLKYCALCHGASGKGDGRAAALQEKPPADLTASRITHAERLTIVRDGGSAVNRSASMPAWREVLSEREITDVVAYLQTMTKSTVQPSAVSASAGKAR